MSNLRISELSSTTSGALSGTDLFATLDVSDTTMAASGTDKAISAKELAIYGGVHNAKAYGATGDGTTDDTTAVQNAINAAAAVGGSGVCYIPPGTYICSALTIPPGITLQGASGQVFLNEGGIPNPNTVSCIKKKTASSSALISPYDGGANISSGVVLRELDLDGNSVSQRVIDLPDQGSSVTRFWGIERCYIHDVGGAGYAVYVGNQNSGVYMDGCTVLNVPSGTGVGWYGADGTINLTGIGSCSVGLYLLGGASYEYFKMYGGGIWDGGFANVIVGGNGGAFYGTSFDHSHQDGVYCSGNVSFIACSWHTNGMDTDNTYSDISINADNVKIAVIGCHGPAHTGETANNVKYFIDAKTHSATLTAKGVSSTASNDLNLFTKTFGTSYLSY